MKNITKIFVCLLLLTYHLPVFSMANPASVNCVKQGFKLVLINSTGICLFYDGTYCEEWAYFRGNCTQGENKFPGGGFQKDMLDQYCMGKSGNQPIVEMCPKQ